MPSIAHSRKLVRRRNECTGAFERLKAPVRRHRGRIWTVDWGDELASRTLAAGKPASCDRDDTTLSRQVLGEPHILPRESVRPVQDDEDRNWAGARRPRDRRG
jgi:hypothetical protein